MTFNGPAPTDTQFDTVEIISQYDGLSDFPLYPLNLVSTANALLGIVYVHPHDLDPSLAADAPGPPPIHTKTGDTDYYFFETENLPLFDPLRTLGVPEPLIDVVEPFFKVIVELGYDRSIPPGEPTPARLIPPTQPREGGRRSGQRDRRGRRQRCGVGRDTGAADAARGHPRRSRRTCALGRSGGGNDDQRPHQHGHRCGEVGNRQWAQHHSVRW